MTTYIGITGTKGVGKTTLAAMLKDELPGSEIIAFADALRDEVNWAINMSDLEAEDHACGTFFTRYDDHEDVPRSWLEERKATVFGPLLQGWGEFRRQWHGDDYWIKELSARSHCLDTVIVPDVRHANEAEWIKEQGGLLVAITGPSRWEGDQRDANHPSEANVPACQAMADLTVSNEGGIGYLRAWATVIARRASSRNVETMLVTP